MLDDSQDLASRDAALVGAADCDFCLRLDGSMPDRPWFDFAEVGSSHSFVTVVALGALTPGHILIVSRRHVERAADLDIDELMELETVLSHWHNKLGKRWRGARFVFEHGGRSATSPSSCVAHAHLQMLPIDLDPINIDASFVRLLSIGELQLYRHLDYILVSIADGIFVSVLRHAQAGQFLRRRVCEMMGRPGSWDYLAFPNLETMRLTLAQLANEDECL